MLPEKKLFSTLMIGLMSLTLVACSKSGTTQSVEDAIDKQILYINIGSEVQNLDPHTVTGVPESRVLRGLLEGLTGKDATNLEPIPAAAKSWSISSDGRIYTFELQPDGRWSNGDPVTADDFIYSWRRILSPALASEYAYFLYPIQGAREYHQGQFEDFDRVGIKALDRFRLQVRLSDPTPYFLQLLDHYATFPVHRTTIEAHGAIAQRDTAWTRPENFVGNGPYLLAKWEINRRIEIHKNPDYRAADAHRLKEIHFFPIENASVEERMFRTGQLHISSSVPTEKIPAYRSTKSHLLREHPLLSTYYFELNVNRKPLDNPLVRRALSISIDRKALVTILKGGQPPAYAMTPPGTAGYTPPESFSYNPDEARRLLARAGFPGGQGFPVLGLLYNTSEGHRRIAESVQQMWQQQLGISIELNNQEWKVYLNSRNAGNFDIARAGWVGDYPDPDTFLDLLLSDSGNNRTGWKNPAYDRLIALSRTATDRDQRYSILFRAEQLMMEAMPVIPVYTYVSLRLVHPSVKGWHGNLMDYHPYRDIYLADEP